VTHITQKTIVFFYFLVIYIKTDKFRCKIFFEGIMTTHQVRILITSVGTARPSASAVIAKGLGLPVSTVVSRLYSAPTTLIDKVDESIATQMINLLVSIGFTAEIQSLDEPAPEPATLYDVAIYIEDARRFQHAVKTLSEFTGINETDASHMILSPPGVVIGSVSKVTVQTLSDQMGEKISVLSSPANTALYSLFLNKEPTKAVELRILEDIKKAGYAIGNSNGAIAADLDHITAKNLWQRYQSTGVLQIINQDFIRYDLILQKPKIDLPLNSVQIQVLKDLAEVPAEIAEEVISSAPITLLESIPKTQVEHYIKTFAEKGINVIASMITFQLLGLEVISISDRVALSNVLQSFGLHQNGQTLPAIPFQTPGAIPELQARIICSTLEDTGAEVNLVEVAI